MMQKTFIDHQTKCSLEIKKHLIEMFLTLQEFIATALQSILIEQVLFNRFCFNPKSN